MLRGPDMAAKFFSTALMLLLLCWYFERSGRNSILGEWECSDSHVRYQLRIESNGQFQRIDGYLPRLEYSGTYVREPDGFFLFRVTNVNCGVERGTFSKVTVIGAEYRVRLAADGFAGLLVFEEKTIGRARTDLEWELPWKRK